MSMANKKKAQIDLLKDVQGDEKREKSEHVDVLVLSATVVSLNVEHRGAYFWGLVSKDS